MLYDVSTLGFDINNFTIEYDFYLNSMSNFNARFFSGNSFNNVARPFDFYIDNNGASFLNLGNGTASETIPNTPAFNTGQWYHVAFVINNTSTKNVKMFVNGNLSVDFNFTQGLLSDSQTSIYIGNKSSNSGDCKFDNLRIWNVLRTNSEILNNFNSCLNNTETGLIAYFNFDRSNNGTFRNRVSSSLQTNGIMNGSFTFSNGTGCTIPEIAPSVEVTGYYAGIYYVIGYLNGKPHYKTDEIECNFTAESPCDAIGYAYQIFWDNTQWVLAPSDCVWLFTSCSSTYIDSSSIIGNNVSTTNFAPCTGWTFVDTSANSTFSSDDCAALSSSYTEFEKNILIYPNPTTDYLIIDTKESISIKVLNMLGETIIHKSTISGINSLELIDLSNGIYILEVTNLDGKVKNFKIIKN